MQNIADVTEITIKKENNLNKSNAKWIKAMQKQKSLRKSCENLKSKCFVIHKKIEIFQFKRKNV